MARKCPNCMATVPVRKFHRYSNDLECPSCKSPLEISALSRNISAFLGLAVAALVWKASSAHYASAPGALGWAFPVLFSFLAWGVASALVLIPTGDLRLRPPETPPSTHEPSPWHHHDSQHHGSH
jgi:hypothetical protein